MSETEEKGGAIEHLRQHRDDEGTEASNGVEESTEHLEEQGITVVDAAGNLESETPHCLVRAIPSFKPMDTDASNDLDVGMDDASVNNDDNVSLCTQEDTDSIGSGRDKATLENKDSNNEGIDQRSPKLLEASRRGKNGREEDLMELSESQNGTERSELTRNIAGTKREVTDHEGGSRKQMRLGSDSALQAASSRLLLPDEHIGRRAREFLRLKMQMQDYACPYPQKWKFDGFEELYGIYELSCFLKKGFRNFKAPFKQNEQAQWVVVLEDPTEVTWEMDTRTARIRLSCRNKKNHVESDTVKSWIVNKLGRGHTDKRERPRRDSIRMVFPGRKSILFTRQRYICLSEDTIDTVPHGGLYFWDSSRRFPYFFKFFRFCEEGCNDCFKPQRRRKRLAQHAYGSRIEVEVPLPHTAAKATFSVSIDSKGGVSALMRMRKATDADAYEDAKIGRRHIAIYRRPRAKVVRAGAFDIEDKFQIGDKIKAKLRAIPGKWKLDEWEELYAIHVLYDMFDLIRTLTFSFYRVYKDCQLILFLKNWTAVVWDVSKEQDEAQDEAQDEFLCHLVHYVYRLLRSGEGPDGAPTNMRPLEQSDEDAARRMLRAFDLSDEKIDHYFCYGGHGYIGSNGGDPSKLKDALKKPIFGSPEMNCWIAEKLGQRHALCDSSATVVNPIPTLVLVEKRSSDKKKAADALEEVQENPVAVQPEAKKEFILKSDAREGHHVSTTKTKALRDAADDTIASMQMEMVDNFGDSTRGGQDYDDKDSRKESNNKPSTEPPTASNCNCQQPTTIGGNGMEGTEGNRPATSPVVVSLRLKKRKASILAQGSAARTGEDAGVAHEGGAFDHDGMGSNANGCMHSSEPEQQEDRAADNGDQILHSGLDKAMSNGQRHTGNSLANRSGNTGAATNVAQEDANRDMMIPDAVPSVQHMPPIADAASGIRAETDVYYGRASNAPTAGPLEKEQYAYLQSITEAAWGDNNDVPYRHFEKCKDNPKLLWCILLKKGECQQHPRALFAFSFGGGGARTTQRSSGSTQVLINLLWTQNGYRRRGYAALLIDEALDDIKEGSFIESGTRDTAMATSFYNKYEFARVVGNCDDGAKFTITAENLRAAIKKQHMTFDLTHE